ncbi:organoarsenical effux MFS transporter ArsJ [Pseudoalteromonas sp. SR44-5]|uniref:organoarsenical effux MFS transporter ArsJ n=1 Tax=Pseudoalteromonas TaxID=53246 RepID=UPI0016012168|nr:MULTISPECIES: organoarsenical effux MFS transporter ArsJ [unclassified Pseudoalteromonas]MBB1335891.1 organoarsenical effux MFS transporter ArsJ [Pseudoalteromonas sp. SR41-6]MBB1343640.1 organoarsenical effux MFS transporter ArsJ [Pseudoalteromonas sp. SR45-6]MBB1368380.1 organoarsenical effux MFS transporter ArsJ [Pseudoalteromonas sp. SR44-5]MBB1416308.1 organoarsenical effux MFS transporter ArsJ [Pseudoalteromonas sp. SG44-1]MBB1436246.1 organoarsenical effux MFS transporter ArsJ [Pseud
MDRFTALSPQIKQYLIITGNYWAFTLTDGALRMLVVLYFYQLGYSPLSIAMLFLFYEIFGVITNLVGGWLGARFGLNKTMNIGLALQIVSLAMLMAPVDTLTVIYVMAAQALSGIAKDLNKMSAKSAIKLLVPKDAQGQLFKWVAILTGSKNALKGVGFFLGGVLLTLLEFHGAMLIMICMLTMVWLFSLFALKEDLGKAKNKAKFSELFSKSKAINVLSAARMFLFGARDVWFVVALPVFLAATFGWDHWWVGGFMASWVIGYGIVQSFAPHITNIMSTGKKSVQVPCGRSAFLWASYLTAIPAIIALALHFDFYIQASVIIGLLIFGAVFAINSSLHSYLIVRLADSDGVSLDVGFYYMANAMGRLLGTVLSGWVYQQYGLEACLWISSCFIALAALLSLALPKSNQ